VSKARVSGPAEAGAREIKSDWSGGGGR